MIPEFPPAQTVRAQDGRVLLFSCEEFVEKICRGNGCFVCGASPNAVPFNDEHIIPRWILRRFNLFEKQITLPARELRRYGGYRVPCCENCNSLLGETRETPVSEILSGSFEEVSSKLSEPSARDLVFSWMALVFLKTHLKDAGVRLHKDRRLGDAVIGDGYSWEDLHHLHAIARTPYTKGHLLPRVTGSLRVYEVDDPVSADDFDYVDLTAAQTVAIRVGRVGLVAVLNDAGFAEEAWAHKLPLIGGPLTGSQFREVVALLAVANDDLVERPTFGTLILEQTTVLHYAQPPATLEMQRYNPEKFGAALLFLLRAQLQTIVVDGKRDPEVVAELIASGRVSFLFDDHGNFRPAHSLISHERRA